MKKGLKVFISVVAVIALFFGVINIIPPKKAVDVNPFIKEKDALPMIAAHRGGGVSNPENTLMAYRAAVNDFGIQICETDLWMTVDGYLVYNHDSTINRMACNEGDEDIVIAEHTLEELKQYNMGYNFKDPDTGEYPYRDLTQDEVTAKGLRIMEFHELLDEFYDTNKDLLFIVEIKDSDEPGFKAAEIIDKALTDEYPDYRNSIVVGTFHPEIEADLCNNHPMVLRGASTKGATEFVVTQMLGVNLFSSVEFSCLQVPMSRKVKGIKLNLTRQTYINRAHRKNIAVQYWTINDADDMRFLIEKGVDAIMTDDPKLLASVLEEYK